MTLNDLRFVVAVAIVVGGSTLAAAELEVARRLTKPVKPSDLLHAIGEALEVVDFGQSQTDIRAGALVRAGGDRESADLEQRRQDVDVVHELRAPLRFVSPF